MKQITPFGGKLWRDPPGLGIETQSAVGDSKGIHSGEIAKQFIHVQVALQDNEIVSHAWEWPAIDPVMV